MEQKIDPKIITAVISGAVSIIVTLMPLLNANERNRFLLILLMAAVLVLAAAGLIAVYRKHRLRVFLATGGMIAVAAAAVLVTGRVLPAPPKLVYVPAQVSVYAGTGQRDFLDGPVRECAFVSPGCLSAWQDTLYLTDSGRLRRLSEAQVETEPFPSDRYNALLVRNHGADVYVLAQTRQDETIGGEYYNVFLRFRNGEAEVISEPLKMGAFASSISDFAFSQSGVLWLVRLYQAPGAATATLEKLSYNRDTDRYGSPEWVMDFPYEDDDMQDARMVFDEGDNLYVTVPGQGVILRLGQGEQECRVFAGSEEDRIPNDRGKPAFAYPTSLAVSGDLLYVLDNGTVRRLTAAGDRVSRCETVAGVVPGEVIRELNLQTVEQDQSITGQEFAFPANTSASLALDGLGRLLLSDPVNGLIYEIREG